MTCPAGHPDCDGCDLCCCAHPDHAARWAPTVAAGHAPGCHQRPGCLARAAG